VASHGGGQGSRVGLLWNVSILRITVTSLGKPKSLQVEEDKALAEDIASMIYHIMSLIGKDIGRGIGYPTRPSQSKGISSILGGREIREIKNLSCSEGVGSGMLTTWLKDASPSTRRVGLTEDFTGTNTSSILG
jgi:hypothetical protein